MSHTVARIYAVIAAAGVLALAIALFSQHQLGMRPCAWCVFQRLILVVLVPVAWLAAITVRRHAAISRLAGLGVVLLGSGGVLSAWYQYTVAAQQFSCAQTFADRFMSSSGLDGALPWLFGIYATCMDARVNLLGLEYALWALGLFVGISLAGIAALWFAWRRPA